MHVKNNLLRQSLGNLNYRQEYRGESIGQIKCLVDNNFELNKVFIGKYR